jgi:hypothetical protein
MVCMIGPLSDAGEAQSDLGTAFRRVEPIRIGQGEHLMLLIWWNQGESWTVSWQVGLGVLFSVLIRRRAGRQEQRCRWW